MKLKVGDIFRFFDGTDVCLVLSIREESYYGIFSVEGGEEIMVKYIHPKKGILESSFINFNSKLHIDMHEILVVE